MLLASIGAITTPVWAQWDKFPTAGIPRTKDGGVDLSAPAPKDASGKPDLTGYWLKERSRWPRVSVGTNSIADYMPPGEPGSQILMKPGAAALYKRAFRDFSGSLA